MRKNWIRIGWMAAALVVMAATAPRSLVHAQNSEQHAVLVSAETGDNSAPILYFIYGSAGGKPLAALGTDYPPDLSVASSARWVLVDQGPNQPILIKDTKTNQTVRTLPADQISSDGVSFSPSTRYLTFTEVHNTSEGTIWVFHIIDLIDNSEWQFGDTLISDINGARKNKDSARAIPGVLAVGGWDDAEKILTLFDFIPESEVQPHDHYLLDVSKLKPSTKTITAPAFKALPGSALLTFSPDRTQAAYLSEDAAHQPKDYQRFGPSSVGPYDTLRLVNLATASIKVVAKAAPEAGIDKISWSADGKRLYFIAGDFGGVDYINNPVLNYVDLATNKIVKGAAIYTSSTDELDDYKICADNG